MKQKHNLAIILILAALLVGVTVRFAMLGSSPLSDAEATAALQALQVSRGSPAVVTTDPAYTVLTAAVFYLFGGTDFLARFWPALAGASILLIPFILRKQIGTITALILTIGIAIDPILTAASREAGSAMIALAALAWGLIFLWKRAYGGTGFMLGLGLFSGASFWSGLSGLFLAGLAGVVLFGGLTIEREEQDPQKVDRHPAASIGQGLLGAVLIVGVLFLIVPQGISGLTSGLVNAFVSLGTTSLQPAGQLLAGLTAYEIFPLLIGLAGFVLGFVRKHTLIKVLSIWFAVAVLLVSLSPDRSFGMFQWLVLPLWISTAWLIPQWVKLSDFYRWIGIGLGSLAFVLCVFGWINTLALVLSSSTESPDTRIRAIALLGAGLLLLLITILIAIGWHWRTAAWGATAGIGVFFLLGTFSGLWHAAGFSPQPQKELWRSGLAPYQQEVLINSIADVSEWSTGRRDWVDITSVGNPSPSLIWALRDFKNVSYVSNLAAAQKPSLVITTSSDQPALAAGYRGQKVTWQLQPVWNEYSVNQWARWLAFRETPGTALDLILWVRSDLFLGIEPIENP